MERRSVLPHTGSVLPCLSSLQCHLVHLLFLLRPLQLSSNMAALLLQSVSLLVLLVVSWPGSQAAAPKQHLCGSHLVDALYLVCGDRGFFYNRVTRDVDPLMGASGNRELATKDQGMLRMLVKRSIQTECCHSPCDLFDLQKYCN